MTRTGVIFLLLALCLPVVAQKSGAAAAKAPGFSESDAADVLARMRRALEGYDQTAFLKLFDSGRMANYPAFRDQISQFFDKYQSFTVSYQLQQTSTESGAGIVLANFALEAVPSDSGVPNLRRNLQMRLVMQWDGKKWEIVDLAPLGLFA